MEEARRVQAEFSSLDADSEQHGVSEPQERVPVFELQGVVRALERLVLGRFLVMVLAMLRRMRKMNRLKQRCRCLLPLIGQ